MQEVKQYRSGQANMQHTGFFAEGARGGSLGLREQVFTFKF